MIGGGEIVTWSEIGIAEDIHEVSVGDIASKVGDHGAVPDGGARFLSGGVVGIWRRIGRGEGGAIDLWQTRRAASGLLAVMKSVGKVVGMTGGVGYGGRTRVCEEAANMDEVVLVYPRLQITKKEGGSGARASER